MKIISILTALFLSTQIYAQATNPVVVPEPKPIKTQKMEFGRYVGSDVESGTLNADVLLNPDNTLVFKLKSADFEIPDPGCTGIFEEIGNDVISKVNCPIEDLKEANVRLDITKVDRDSVRLPDGVEVPVYVDVLGDDPIIFKMKIVEVPVVIAPNEPVKP